MSFHKIFWYKVHFKNWSNDASFQPLPQIVIPQNREFGKMEEKMNSNYVVELEKVQNWSLSASHEKGVLACGRNRKSTLQDRWRLPFFLTQATAKNPLTPIRKRRQFSLSSSSSGRNSFFLSPFPYPLSCKKTIFYTSFPSAFLPDFKNVKNVFDIEKVTVLHLI